MFKYFAAAGLTIVLAACSPETGPDAAEPEISERPNVLLIMLDDLGYSDIGAYGSEIETPHMDALAQTGRSFSQYYVYPRCSPTRAALLTGQYPHEVGLAFLTTPEGANIPEGAYQGYLTPDTPTIAQAFKTAGYKTYMSGKWHLGEAPQHWPMNYGFDRYFGLISGASSYYELVEQRGRVRRMALDDAAWTPPSENFYMTDAFTDHAVETLKDHERNAEDDPFFLYLAYTAPHWPLHAPAKDVVEYDGVYDAGWDKLAETRRERQSALGFANLPKSREMLESEVGTWADYEKKADWSQKMQIHAAMVTIADRGIGQVIDQLEASGDLENTIIMVMADNGASSEDITGRNLNDPSAEIGARGSYVSFEEEGAAFTNTPLRDYKGSAFEGAVRSPLIVSWPDTAGSVGGIDADSVISVLDIAPSLLAAAGISPDITMLPLEGTDMSGAFAGQPVENSEPFYWEHLGWRGVRDGKWKAVSDPKTNIWQLFDVVSDPSEMTNLADEQSAEVDRLSSNWKTWSDRIGAQPLPREVLMRMFAPKQVDHEDQN